VSEVFVVIAEAVLEPKIRAARVDGLYFFWRLELDNGTVCEQYDSAEVEIGLSHRLSFLQPGCALLQKSPVEKYAGQPVITGVRRGLLIPTVKGVKTFAVTLEKGDEGLVLFRKTYKATGGGSYYVFCIGRRWHDQSGPIEEVYHVCPPVVMTHTGRVFKGGIGCTRDPMYRNPYDVFIASKQKKRS
jgi:hypothetical protein